MDNRKIKAKAMCLIVHGDKTLVAMHHDNATGQDFYRVLGGSMNFNESSEGCVRREFQEEIGSDVENLKLLEVIENRFVFEGNEGHEIVFLYGGDLSRKDLYGQRNIRAIENYGEFDAVWIPVQDVLNGPIPLYPKFDYTKYLLQK